MALHPVQVLFWVFACTGQRQGTMAVLRLGSNKTLSPPVTGGNKTSNDPWTAVAALGMAAATWLQATMEMQQKVDTSSNAPLELRQGSSSQRQQAATKRRRDAAAATRDGWQKTDPLQHVSHAPSLQGFGTSASSQHSSHCLLRQWCNRNNRHAPLLGKAGSGVHSGEAR